MHVGSDRTAGAGSVKGSSLEKPQGNRKSVDRIAITLTMFESGWIRGKDAAK